MPPPVSRDEPVAEGAGRAARTAEPTSAERGVSRPLEAGDRVAGYRLITPIGSGGMGRVFLAHDDALDRKVALKVLPPEDADDEGRARFLRESRALARVDHPHVVRVFASGDDDGVAWMALEYIEGDPLSLLVEEGPLDEETALSLAAQAARGLAAAHAEGVVHRDVKPDNLLLDDEGLLRVVDFGIALVSEPQGRGGFTTQAGVAVGTPHYMAPEQARGAAVDARVDAWGLGATLFTLLAGRPPFFVDDDEPDLDILARVLRDPVPDVRTKAPGVSDETARLVARLLEKDRDTRLADLAEVAAVLDELADRAMRAPTAEEGRGEAEPASVASPAEPAPVASSSEPLPEEEARPEGAAEVRGVQIGLLLVAALLFLAAGGVFGKMVIDRRSEARVADGRPPATRADPEPQPREVRPPDGQPEAPLAVTLPVAPPGRVELSPEGPAAPADPEAELKSLVEAAARGGPELDEALAALVARDDAAATRALVDLVGAEGPAGDRALDAISSARATRHLRAVEAALFGSRPKRQRRAISILVDIRNVEALQLLYRASEQHEDPKVRALALKARRELFSVEGE